MFLCYCTNIWNHHQGPVATELARLLGSNDFRFALYQPLDHPYSINRLKMGWNILPPRFSWVVQPPITCSDVDYTEHLAFAREAEVLIFNSSVPYITHDLLMWRKRHGKLSLRMGERPYKQQPSLRERISLRKIIGRMILRHRLESAKIHFLTMGHGCAEDLAFIGACKGRTWRWGYLTEVSTSCCVKPVRDRVKIGWCGRMLDWKRVDLIIRAVAILPEDVQARCELHLVGDGDQKVVLEALTRQLHISHIVSFHQTVTSEGALNFMRDIDVYAFPSNRQEGWGAALLEAMDKGCVPVANVEAGSSLEVIQDGVNGFTFKDGDFRDLSSKLAWLIVNDDARRKMGVCAWQTIQRWSPKVGASRLVRLVSALRAGHIEEVPQFGLCSRVW